MSDQPEVSGVTWRRAIQERPLRGLVDDELYALQQLLSNVPLLAEHIAAPARSLAVLAEVEEVQRGFEAEGRS